MSAHPNAKKLLIIAHDMAMTGLAAFCALALRFEGEMLAERLRILVPVLPGFVVFTGLIYAYFHLYKGKWRFASMPDLITIAQAVGLICLLLVLGDYAIRHFSIGGEYFLGRRIIILYWLIQCLLLGAPRMIYRYWKDRYREGDSRKDTVHALLLGRGADVEIIIRALQANKSAHIVPVGILSPRPGDLGQAIRNVPVEGTLDALEDVVRQYRVAGTPIRRLLAAPSALEDDPERLSARASKLGLALAHVQRTGEAGAAIAPVEIEDVLSRPPVDLAPELLERAIRGKVVLITGGGGSIGTEICQCCLSLGAKRLIVIENAEPALYEIMETLRARKSRTELVEYLCDIRDRDRLTNLMARVKPDTVFHAAALKQVPYLERDWGEGIRTNTIGSVNAADAAIAAGAAIVVMISTDKAVRPVSVLGATKRLAEIAMQARDAQNRATGIKTRLISVRFGNVLGSAGSVIPRFKAQIARGGPITVTHPDMVRYFMTVTEAANLVMAAAAHALVSAGISVYVLRMGQPVRIYDLAERMIRLSGYEPHKDIPIKTVGIRPGERLNEALFEDNETRQDTGIDGVMGARMPDVSMERIQGWLRQLETAIEARKRESAEAILREAIPDFVPAPLPSVGAPEQPDDAAASPAPAAPMGAPEPAGKAAPRSRRAHKA